MMVWFREDGESGAMNVRPFSMPVFTRETAVMRENLPDIESIRREAYDEGFRKGEADGFTQGEERAAALAERLEHVIGELTALKPAVLGELQTQGADLVIRIARAVIMRELRTDEGLIVELVREAVKRLDRSGMITVTVSPQLYDLFVRHKPSLTTVHPDIAFDVDPSAKGVSAVVNSATEAIVVDGDELLRNVTEEFAEVHGTH